VAPEQSLSLAHCPQTPWLAPVAGQMFDLQAEPLLHGPSPVARPHLLSVSQTPLTQTRAPVPALQVPLIGAAAGSG
jgi:hypothetical protein